jgi:prevent-host-death family protein
MRLTPGALKKNLSDILKHVAKTGERVAVVSRGKVKAAIICAEELELLEDLDEALAAWEDEEGDAVIDLEELEAELGLADVEAPARKRE